MTPTAPTALQSMAEVRAATGSSGLTVASLFAGCGGSSLGYRMAGFRVTLAAEWDATAQATYRLNADPSTAIEGDVSHLTGERILETADGELDVLDGSPPCQGFSHAGRRRLGDDRSALYFQFVRLVREAMPRAFAAENVEGLATGRMREAYFLPVLAMLRRSGYRVAARTLDASWLGVPQARRRVVLIGLRDDLGLDPAAAFPIPFPRRTAVRDVLPEVERIVTVPTQAARASQLRRRQIEDILASRPAPTILASDMGGRSIHPLDDVRLVRDEDLELPPTVDELKALCSFPADFALPQGISLARAWRMFGNAVPPLMARAWAASIRDALQRGEPAASAQERRRALAASG